MELEGTAADKLAAALPDAACVGVVILCTVEIIGDRTEDKGETNEPGIKGKLRGSVNGLRSCSGGALEREACVC